MRAISATILPAETREALRYLDDRVRLLVSQLDEIRASLFTVSYTAPDKPREGMIRFADGTTWDPGSGRGLYQYVSSAWVKL
jgi:hypothetical protein